MAEWTGVAVQTVNPGEAIVFTENPVPCAKGLIQHRDDSGAFLLSGSTNGCQAANQCRCPCCNLNKSVQYVVDFGANIAVPTGETVGPISVAYAVDGNTLQGTTMIVTPAAVEEYFNVSPRDERSDFPELLPELQHPQYFEHSHSRSERECSDYSLRKEAESKWKSLLLTPWKN